MGLMIASHNWWYGQALPRHTGKLVHLVHALLVLAGPILFWLSYGPNVLAPFAPGPWWQHALAGYVVVCWLLGFAYLPCITVWRWRRGEPAVVRSVRGRVIDVAKEL